MVSLMNNLKFDRGGEYQMKLKKGLFSSPDPKVLIHRLKDELENILNSIAILVEKEY